MKKLKYILLAVSAIVMFQGNVIKRPLISNFTKTEGLIAYYPFNGNANDESGNGHDGIVNGASLTTDRNLNNNSAYDFNGTNQYIYANDDNSLTLNQMSISVWINANSKLSFKVFGKGINFSDGEYTFGSTGAGKIGLILIDSDNIGYRGKIADFTGNAWVHIVCTYDGTTGTNAADGIKLYQNTIELTTSLISGGTYDQMRNTSNDIYIGLYNNQYANGKIDDIRLYNRVLNQYEINALYNE